MILHIIEYLNFIHYKNLKILNYKDKLNNNFDYKNIPNKVSGIYVPANLPYTLLMNAIPAKIAKVKKIIV